MGDQDVRASDAEREQVADALRRAAGDGRLAPDELEERLTAAYGARTRGELGPLTSDLPAPPAAPGSGRPPVRPASWTAGLPERLGAWLIPNLICVGIWLASGAHGNFWPVWVLLFTTVALVRSVVGGPQAGPGHRRRHRHHGHGPPPGPPAPPPRAASAHPASTRFTPALTRAARLRASTPGHRGAAASAAQSQRRYGRLPR